ncbi:hypothetical protein [Halioxenophilus aromaticivorans]|uniref:Uncharacterized protein n=1 Tax=Halioxenophilus aromaticivorans TaxID=1306992 RepID=A0AAV3U1H1_9ALTE
MILRRLANAIRKQDWFTVFIETLIVVFGVYLGIQLGNWNSDSAATRSERAVLMQLHGELIAAKVQVGPEGFWYVDDYPTTMKALLTAFFDGDNKLPAGALCNAVSTSHVLLNVVGELSAVSELISTGRLSSITDPELRSAIASFHELSTRKKDRLPELSARTNMLPNLFPNYFSLRAIWDDTQGQVRWTSKCDIEAMQADQSFRNLLAINADAYDGWYRMFIDRTDKGTGCAARAYRQGSGHRA